MELVRDDSCDVGKFDSSRAKIDEHRVLFARPRRPGDLMIRHARGLEDNYNDGMEVSRRSEGPVGLVVITVCLEGRGTVMIWENQKDVSRKGIVLITPEQLATRTSVCNSRRSVSSICRYRLDN